LNIARPCQLRDQSVAYTQSENIVIRFSTQWLERKYGDAVDLIERYFRCSKMIVSARNLESQMPVNQQICLSVDLSHLRTKAVSTLRKRLNELDSIRIQDLPTARNIFPK